MAVAILPIKTTDLNYSAVVIILLQLGQQFFVFSVILLPLQVLNTLTHPV